MRPFIQLSLLFAYVAIAMLTYKTEVWGVMHVTGYSDYQRYGHIPAEVRFLFDELLALLVLDGLVRQGPQWALCGAFLGSGVVFFIRILRAKLIFLPSELKIVQAVQRYAHCALFGSILAVMVSLVEGCFCEHVAGGYAWGVGLDCLWRVPNYVQLSLLFLLELDSLWMLFRKQDPSPEGAGCNIWQILIFVLFALSLTVITSLTTSYRPL